MTSSAATLLAHFDGVASTLVPFALLGVPSGLVLLGAMRRRRTIERRTGWWRPLAAVVGLAALAVALAPQVEDAAENTFAAHMVQHLLFTAAAAPLLVVGHSARAMRRGLAALGAGLGAVPRSLAPFSRWGLSGSGALAAGLVASVTMVAWHLPPLYEAAIADDLLHTLEHLTLFGTALWFWAAVLLTRVDQHLAVLALLVNAITHAALGGLLTFAPRPLIEPYADAGLSDQQLAGLLMWVPAGAVHLAAAAALVAGWIARSERRSQRRSLLADRRRIVSGAELG